MATKIKRPLKWLFPSTISKEYQRLLDRAYNALFENESFKKALDAAGPKTIFKHSIGHNNRKETVLTESEFCKRIQHLKDFGLIKIEDNEIEGEW